MLAIGWPGSCVAEFARAISAHSRVESLSNLNDARADGSLLIASNATEVDKTTRELRQLDRAAEDGIRTGLVFLVKSPLLVLAEVLDEKHPGDQGEQADAFWDSTRDLLCTISASAPRFARRLVFKHRLAR